jgi:hypothetical protein
MRAISPTFVSPTCSPVQQRIAIASHASDKPNTAAASGKSNGWMGRFLMSLMHALAAPAI